jgi:hypothetical protein
MSSYGVRTAARGLVGRTRRAGAAVLTLVALAAGLAVLDLVSPGFSAWWRDHALLTAVVVGVFTGVTAGILLDQRAQARERARWGFQREPAVFALCQARKAAESMFSDAVLRSMSVRYGYAERLDEARASCIAAAKNAANTFDTELAKWRGVLKSIDEPEFLDHCERFARVLANAVPAFEMARSGDDEYSKQLNLAEQVIADDRAYFSDQMDAEFRRIYNETMRSMELSQRQLRRLTAKRAARLRARPSSPSHDEDAQS